ncbi:MAG TPA: sensor histidine kinase, partial [Ferruginibacter sp.]|nr:sensor histidine kinase [Ferruginibacter sp.]
DNVAGAINISRIANINFDDKSSREGLQENDEFQIFKQLIIGIIKIFEEDRALIAREMLLFYNDKNFEKINRQAAEKLAASIRERREKDKEEGKESEDNDELYILAELNKDKDVQIEKLEDEQKVLRGLASSGIVLASFSHDLSKLNNVLDSRIDKIKELISQKLNEKDYVNTENRINPFAQLEKMRKQDIKLQNWLNFSLGAARKDKRTRKQLYFETYFKDFKTDWATTLINRGIDLDITGVTAIDMRVFEIDIDSIFNNLLVNSVDAFNLSKINRNRIIKINVFNTEKEIIAEYYDSGPGLSPDIDKPERIFEPLYTTKRNKHTGEEEGTGLGMWLVKSIITEYDGSVKLLFPEHGFGLRMNFPVKYKTTQDV